MLKLGRYQPQKIQSSHLKFYEKQVSLINKLQPLSYQFTSNITPHLPLHASQQTPKICNAILHYSHIPITHKKIYARVVQMYKCTLPQRLILYTIVVSKLNKPPLLY